MKLFTTGRYMQTSKLFTAFACVTSCVQMWGQPGATVPVTVRVPVSMRTSPFHVARTLKVPSGFDAAVYARIPGARFLATTPDNNLLVSQPSSGSVLLVRPNGAGDPLITTYVGGMRRPHDIVFHSIGNRTYVYIAESHQINRFTWIPGSLNPQSREIVISGLPDASTPELQGAYGHELKNIAMDVNDNLYVSIASTCNVCLSDTTSNPVRAAIYRYDADGRNGRLFARGLRNAEGLAFLPGTTNLWVTVNQRDNIPYPNQDGTGQYGRVIPAYVDNHPPEALTSVRDNGNYGWPFCNPNPDTPGGLNSMPFDRDVNFNAGGQVSCDSMDRISKGIQAHSAPLGFTFLHNTNAPSDYRSGGLVALHGSWNRQIKTGYKIAYFPWIGAQIGSQIDLVTGWLNPNGSVWGRPVDTAVDQGGSILISDDYSGTIYKVSRTVAEPTLPDPAAWYRLVASHSGKCLDVYGFSTAERGPIVQWACHTGNNQQFQFVPVSSGVYRVLSRHSGKVLSIAGGPGATNSGARLEQASWSGFTSQQWRLLPEAGGYYRFTPLHSGHSLDVCGVSLDNGVCVTQWQDWGGGNQRFRLDVVR
ncbi:MAG: RICIN domain-containing protein [Bryobacteraceae bacterium]|nr:RICIN domain-containing protein [Bryobacteraceae bacterium]